METWNRIGVGRTRHLITHGYGQLFQIAACSISGKASCAPRLPKCKKCRKVLDAEAQNAKNVFICHVKEKEEERIAG